MSKERKLNTDCKTTYNILKNRIEVIDYDNDNHRLYFLNKIISNLNSQFIDRFHGVTKRMLPLYYSEFEWRFNHRNCESIMDKIKNYIMQSSIATRKMIRDSMDQYARLEAWKMLRVVRWVLTMFDMLELNAMVMGSLEF